MVNMALELKRLREMLVPARDPSFCQCHNRPIAIVDVDQAGAVVNGAFPPKCKECKGKLTASGPINVVEVRLTVPEPSPDETQAEQERLGRGVIGELLK